MTDTPNATPAAPGGHFNAATKRLIYIAVGVIALVGLQLKFNLIPFSASQKALVPTSVDLPTGTAAVAPDPNVTEAPLPSTATGRCVGGVIRTNIWAWNAQMGLIYANGGPRTTANSLMEKHGVCVNLIRQDDTDKSKPEQVKFAQLMAHGDPNPSDGIQFVVIMGDGAAQYLVAVNKQLAKLGPDYRAEIVGAVGYSRGEDAFLAPAAWKDDPTQAKGGYIAGVLRDGDWDIAQYWAAQNGILNNPDDKFYDPNAINWFAADDYLKAAEAYTQGPDPQSGVCNDLPVVTNGKTTGEKKHVCVNAVVTWTPGDVNIAHAKGGLVKVLSTKENAYQMPAVVIGIHKWNVAHAKQVESFLQAALEGGDQVKHYPDALKRAGQAAYAVYGEESAAYWIKYYNGVTERDKAGNPVNLGGSTVMNLGDNLVLFGLFDGTGDANSSMFRATYEGFGNIAHQQYPTLIPDFPKVNEAVNTDFLKALQSASPQSKPALASYDNNSGDISDVTAKRDWNIQFNTGQATFTPSAIATLNDLYSKLVVNSLFIEIDGHTDNTGSSDANMALSQARADAVKQWLVSKSSTLFPDTRIDVKWFGDTKPVAPNTTEAGRAQNRRVSIILGSK